MSQSPPPPLLPPEKRALGDLAASQKIFDTVTGPNLRLRDNLIQLASVILSVLTAIPITYLITHDPAMAIGLGLLIGLIAGVLISGVAIGVYRFIKGVYRK